MFLHQAVVVNDVENLSSTDAHEVNGEKVTVSKKEELRNGTMTADDWLKLYENENTDTGCENVNLEDEDESVKRVTVEDILNFYENDLNYDSDGNFANIGDKSMNCREKSQLRIDSTDVGLQRSTRKSRK